VKDGKTIEFYRAFTVGQVEKIIGALNTALGELGESSIRTAQTRMSLWHSRVRTWPITCRSYPHKKTSVSSWISWFLGFGPFFPIPRSIRLSGDSGAITLEQWLKDYVGGSDSTEDQLVVLDLSLVPTEVVHVVAAVTSRMIFESLQRYRKLNKVVLPTVLVMEEAHAFIRRYKDDIETYDAATVCCQVFERIAREGRKFGLGLVLSSQRPSELSPTVLSQCNTFLLHRISNDRDQELVHRLVPDNLRGLLRELPSLPSQNAILLGWASELPVLVRIDDLPKTHQPRSDDPDFWSVWTGKDAEGNVVERKANWKPIADDWQGK